MRSRARRRACGLGGLEAVLTGSAAAFDLDRVNRRLCVTTSARRIRVPALPIGSGTPRDRRHAEAAAAARAQANSVTFPVPVRPGEPVDPTCLSARPGLGGAEVRIQIKGASLDLRPRVGIERLLEQRLPDPPPELLLVSSGPKCDARCDRRSATPTTDEADGRPARCIGRVPGCCGTASRSPAYPAGRRAPQMLVEFGRQLNRPQPNPVALRSPKTPARPQFSCRTQRASSPPTTAA